MLAMRRESGEYVVIGEDIVVQVIEVGGQLRLAIDAPDSVAIQRGEYYEKTRPAPLCIQHNRKRQDLPTPFGFNRTT